MKKILILIFTLASLGLYAQQTVEATDNLNTGRIKINDNFSELYGFLGNITWNDTTQHIVTSLFSDDSFRKRRLSTLPFWKTSGTTTLNGDPTISGGVLFNSGIFSNFVATNNYGDSIAVGGLLPDGHVGIYLKGIEGIPVNSEKGLYYIQDNSASGLVFFGDRWIPDFGAVANAIVDSIASIGGGGGDALKADPLSQFAITTSAQLAGIINGKTGTGNLVFDTNPSITGGTFLGGTSINGTLSLANHLFSITGGTNSLTIATTGASSVTMPTSGTLYSSGTADVSVNDGGTGRSTGTTAYSLIATGTTATGAQQTLANGATTQILVGGGASALPVWTTATGTGAPVRSASPTFTGTVVITDGDITLGDVFDSDLVKQINVINSTGDASLAVNVEGGILVDAGATSEIQFQSGEFTVAATSAATVEFTGGSFKFDGKLQSVIVTGTTITLSEAHRGKILYFENAAGCTVTVPTTLPIDWVVTLVEDFGAGAVTLTSSDAISASSGVLSSNGDGSVMVLHQKEEAEWRLLNGSPRDIPVFIVTGTTHTLDATHNGAVIYYKHASGTAVTVPTDLQVEFSCTLIEGNGAGTVTASGSDTFVGTVATTGDGKKVPLIQVEEGVWVGN